MLPAVTLSVSSRDWRVIANGDGAEILLTLFREGDMDDARFAADAEWVRRDLETLRDLAESDRL